MIDQRAAQAGRGKGRPNRLTRNLMSKIAALPMIITTLVVFVGATIWTIVYSFTNSRLLPKDNFVGFDQYERLWEHQSLADLDPEPLMWYGVSSLILTLVIGFTLAALLDRKIRFENTFRSIFLYPLCAVVHRHGPCRGSGY